MRLTPLLLLITFAGACGGFNSGINGGISSSRPETGSTFVDTSSTEDADGDGYSPSAGDCDDTLASVHPTADETMGDGVDSNCDGEDDT